jgi:hypothetical protein
MYQMKDGIVLVIYTTPKFGLMAVFENVSTTNLLDQVVALNLNAEKLNTSFQFPNGVKISYDVFAPKSKWVIKSVNDELQKRNFDRWSLIDGNFNE